MNHIIELDLHAILAEKIKSPEDFVALINHLEVGVFQDWDYTEKAFKYYLNTFIQDGDEIAGHDNPEGRALLRKAINIFTKLLDK